jgi:phage protein D
MPVLYECPQCSAVRTRKMDIQAHCRNVKDHRGYESDRLKSTLDDESERELAPPPPTR